MRARRAVLITILGLLIATVAVSRPGPAVAEPTTAARAFRPELPLAYTLVAPVAESASSLIIRTVAPAAAACPTLESTDTATSATVATVLTERTTPRNTGPWFSSVRVCEIAVPSGSGPTGQVVFTDGVTRTVPTALSGAIDSMAIIGDTGCRIVYNIEQDCRSGVGWPLARFARGIAARAPDVVIHVGDYFYDQDECRDAKLCGDSPAPASKAPFSDTADSFFFEFLDPISPVFAVAPLLLIRGNQETCDVDGVSYFYFLDPHFGTSQTCAPVRTGGRLVAPSPLQPAYAIDLSLANGSVLRAVVVDSSLADDEAVTELAVKDRPGFVKGAELSRLPGASSWLLTHRPLFGIRPNWQCGFVCTPFSRRPSASMWVSSDIAAAAQGQLDGYRMILSGHIHLTEGVQVPGQPGQLVAGGGGTTLDPDKAFSTPSYGQLANGLGRPMSPTHKPYPKVERWFKDVRFSYGMATPGVTADDWAFAFIGVDGKAVARCTLSGRDVRCR